jgi:hypothetical protein
MIKEMATFASAHFSNFVEGEGKQWWHMEKYIVITGRFAKRE